MTHGWEAVVQNAMLLGTYAILWVFCAALMSTDVPETSRAGKIVKGTFVTLSVVVPLAIFVVASVQAF